MSDGGKLSRALVSPTPSDSDVSILSRASTIERELDCLRAEACDDDVDEADTADEEECAYQPLHPAAQEHPHLSLLLDLFRQQLPTSTCDAIERLINRVRPRASARR